MLEKISIIAGIEETESSCLQWDRGLYAHHWLVAKLPITIKHFRSAEQGLLLRVEEHRTRRKPLDKRRKAKKIEETTRTKVKESVRHLQ